MYKNKSTTSKVSFIKHIFKKTYFRDIHLFFEHVYDIINIKDDESVRINL